MPATAGSGGSPRPSRARRAVSDRTAAALRSISELHAAVDREEAELDRLESLAAGSGASAQQVQGCRVRLERVLTELDQLRLDDAHRPQRRKVAVRVNAILDDRVPALLRRLRGAE